MEDHEIFLTVGSMDLKISKKGKIQVRTHKGIAIIPKGFGIAHDDERITLTAPFTTNSPTWIDVTGLSFDKKKIIKLEKIMSYFRKNRKLLERISEKSPIELVWFDLDFGFIKARFKPKKKKPKSNNQ